MNISKESNIINDLEFNNLIEKNRLSTEDNAAVIWSSILAAKFSEL
mgnify:CR=1 FL=1